MLGPQPGPSLQVHHDQGPRPEYSDRANVSSAYGRCFQKCKGMGRYKAATYSIRHDISRMSKMMPCVPSDLFDFRRCLSLDGSLACNTSRLLANLRFLPKPHSARKLTT